ncbi:hypothetical protein [Sphingobium sp.]|uniref:hypothetical protein n=1 Tax=Sphingobium sp. TaxID=1912891 RepID=UPI0035C71DC3
MEATLDLNDQPGAEPISLYFALAPGQKADMEVAARAAIAFADTIKELAALFDPMAAVRIELESGSESSLGLNALIRKIKGFPANHPGWFAFLVAVAVNVSGDVRSWAVGQILDYMSSKDAPQAVQRLDKKDAEAIAEEVAAMLKNDIAKASTRQIFKEVQRDPAIVGVGVTAHHRTKPAVLIPRSDFGRASGEGREVENLVKARVGSERMRVTLKKPRLEAVVSSWRFQHGSLPEFSAEMRDREFLRAFEEGRIDLPLRIGTEMDVELETEQEFEAGVWVIKKRSITKVYAPRAGTLALGLFPDD